MLTGEYEASKGTYYIKISRDETVDSDEEMPYALQIKMGDTFKHDYVAIEQPSEDTNNGKESKIPLTTSSGGSLSAVNALQIQASRYQATAQMLQVGYQNMASIYSKTINFNISAVSRKKCLYITQRKSILWIVFLFRLCRVKKGFYIMTAPLMPRATAVWLVENTTLTFRQIAEFCELHELEIQAIADGDVSSNIMGLSPLDNGQLTAEEIKRCEADACANLVASELERNVKARNMKAKKVLSPSQRQDKPNAIAWIVKIILNSKTARFAKLSVRPNRLLRLFVTVRTAIWRSSVPRTR